MVLLSTLLGAEGARAHYGFTVEVPDPIQIAPLGDFTILKTIVTNTGDLPDTLDVSLEITTADSSWLVLLCVGPICFPPGVREAPLGLAAFESDSVTVDITPMNVQGDAQATLRFVSRGDTSATAEAHLTLISDGTKVLLVDGDGGSAYEGWYRDALPGTVSRATWDTRLEPPTAADIATFEFCVWLTGERMPALTQGEMDELAAYLDGGGKLFISGQDIGRDIGLSSFYADYLRASFITDSAGILTLDGIDGEPISDGLTIGIGGGAGNQVSPDEIAPLGGGAYATFLYEGTNRVAAVSSAYETPSDSARVVYFGFGFEGIDAPADREIIMQRILEYLGGVRVGIGDDTGPGATLPVAAALHPNFPNPFNPSTTIAFDLASPAPVTLSIFDLRGRLVRTLVDRELPAGRHAVVWDGRGRRGEVVASGTYLYRLVAGGETVTRRMTAVK
jgi:hypothetical protein